MNSTGVKEQFSANSTLRLTCKIARKRHKMTASSRVEVLWWIWGGGPSSSAEWSLFFFSSLTETCCFFESSLQSCHLCVSTARRRREVHTDRRGWPAALIPDPRPNGPATARPLAVLQPQFGPLTSSSLLGRVLLFINTYSKFCFSINILRHVHTDPFCRIWEMQSATTGWFNWFHSDKWTRISGWTNMSQQQV